MILLSLLLFESGYLTASRDVPAAASMAGEVRRSPSSFSSSVANLTSKYKTKEVDICKYSAKFDNATLSESERVVPTGPNPLHNR